MPFILRYGSEGNVILFLGAILVVATVLVCCSVAYLISKRLALYGALYYAATSVGSLVFSVMAVNKDWVHISGSYNGLFSVYAILMGISFLISLVAAAVVRMFWKEHF